MSRRRVWLGIGGYWVAAATVVVAVGAGPLTSWPPAGAAAAGAAGGLVLFAALARRAPPRRVPPLLACVLVASAAAEEILWRRVALGLLSGRVGWPAALVASTLLFAFAHRRVRGSRLAAGAAFGGLYVLSGGLLAPLCAHAAYNLAVAGAVTGHLHAARASASA